MRSAYKVTDKEGLYFITSTIVEWLPIFRTKKYFDIIIDSIKFCQKNKSLKIYAYVIMENHFHMIVSCEHLSSTMQSLKMFTAKRILEELEADGNKHILELLRIYKLHHKVNSEHQVWQEGFHPKQILTDNILSQKIEYIHHNPVRKGLVKEPEEWKYSSARFYLLREECDIILNEFE